MLKTIQEFRRSLRLKKTLLPFYQEVRRNLEIYYVMDQRQFFDQTFHLEAWGNIREVPDLTITDRTRTYAERLESFNEAFREYRDYEEWFNADPERKTRDNSAVFHKKKQAVTEAFKGLGALIKDVFEHLEKTLEKIGLLK
jgi:hypothetical protein